MEVACENSANLEQETKTTKIVTYPLFPLAAQWIDYPPAVRDIIGSIPVGDSDFLFVLCLSHSSFADLNMFKRILNAVFADYLHQCLSIYVNDIIMRAQTHHDVL